ncbi:MAG TPA: hypothetical protein VGK10_19465 [Prolixibacteraceae bacterium]|jgi:hypothetical protein
MAMFDFLFYMFYCAAGDDGTESKHGMVAYGMELVATQILSFFTFILVGAINFHPPSFIFWILSISVNAIVSYFSINSYYIKSGRYNKILSIYANTTNRQKLLYKTITIFLFVISFVLLFVGGITMSYLFSLYK